MEVGADAELAEFVEDAFPGTSLDVSASNGAFEIEVRQHGLLRPLHTGELSDGTLRYLLLIAALLTPRPPPLMVFNEPETSLHPDLIPPLGRLLARAATRSQILVISHSQELVAALAGVALAVPLSKADRGSAPMSEPGCCTHEDRASRLGPEQGSRRRDRISGKPVDLPAVEQVENLQLEGNRWK